MSEPVKGSVPVAFGTELPPVECNALGRPTTPGPPLGGPSDGLYGPVGGVTGGSVGTTVGETVGSVVGGSVVGVVGSDVGGTQGESATGTSPVAPPSACTVTLRAGV